MSRVKDKRGNITTNMEDILTIGKDFYHLLYKSCEVSQDTETELKKLTSEKGILNRGSEAMPNITLDENELALRKTKTIRPLERIVQLPMQ